MSSGILDDLVVILKEKINVLDERIERKSGATYYNQDMKISNQSSEAMAYENVLKIIDELKRVSVKE